MTENKNNNSGNSIGFAAALGPLLDYFMAIIMEISQKALPLDCSSEQL